MAETPQNHEIRVLPLEGALNVRDLGGYTGADGRRTRWRHLFRSGTTHALTEADRQCLADLQIRAVVDLRSPDERTKHPHGLFGQEGIFYWTSDRHRVSGNLMKMANDPLLEAAHLRDAMIDLYAKLPYEFSDIYQQLFREIASGPLPLIFGCAAGKDRTGVVAALLLCALGVTWEDVVADYLLTEQFVPDIVRTFSRSKTGKNLKCPDPVVTAPLFQADRAYLEAMRAGINSHSGSIEKYFHAELGLEPQTIETLRQRLLE